VKSLTSLAELEDVCLCSPNLTDDSVAYLSKLPKLRWLALSSPRITDASLEYIVELKSLEELDLRHTSVTRDAINRLHAKMPKTWMTYSWPAF
jgi:Leucine-rich repeat (LRR) protein